MEDKFRRTPTRRAKCRISSSGRPLRFELWGAHEDLSPTSSRFEDSQGSRLHEEQRKRRKVYTSSGHHCGVMPYSSLWCGGLPLGLMRNSTKEEQPREGLFLWWCDELLGGVQSLLSLSFYACSFDGSTLWVARPI